MHTLILNFYMLYCIELLIRNLSRNMLHTCLTEWKMGMKDQPAQRNSQTLVVATGSISEAHLVKGKLLISLCHWCPSIANRRNAHTPSSIHSRKNDIILIFNILIFSGFFVATELAQPNLDIHLFLGMNTKCFSCGTKHTVGQKFYHHYRLYHTKPWGSLMYFIRALFNISQ